MVSSELLVSPSNHYVQTTDFVYHIMQLGRIDCMTVRQIQWHNIMSVFFKAGESTEEGNAEKMCESFGIGERKCLH